jgi:hypothetical protein
MENVESTSFLQWIDLHQRQDGTLVKCLCDSLSGFLTTHCNEQRTRAYIADIYHSFRNDLGSLERANPGQTLNHVSTGKERH